MVTPYSLSFFKKDGLFLTYDDYAALEAERDALLFKIDAVNGDRLLANRDLGAMTAERDALKADLEQYATGRGPHALRATIQLLKDELADARLQLDVTRAELAIDMEAVALMQAKLEDYCGCELDAEGEVCMVHSPIVTKLRQELLDLRAMLTSDAAVERACFEYTRAVSEHLDKYGVAGSNERKHFMRAALVAALAPEEP